MHGRKYPTKVMSYKASHMTKIESANRTHAGVDVASSEEGFNILGRIGIKLHTHTSMSAGMIKPRLWLGGSI